MNLVMNISTEGLTTSMLIIIVVLAVKVKDATTATIITIAINRYDNEDANEIMIMKTMENKRKK